MYEPVSATAVDHSLSDAIFSPRVFIDITGFRKTKAMLLRAHASQLRKYGDQWIETMRTRAAFRGSQVGVEYAEAFEPVKFLWNLGDTRDLNASKHKKKGDRHEILRL